MRLSEDVIRYMTVKQEGPLPTPRPSTRVQLHQIKKIQKLKLNLRKTTSISTDTSSSSKDDTETKETAES